ncbi:MAG: ABC transporter substrate-binding protein, partial [Synergistaceae bacterium]|nr:ABC transporter substrate-binding protein [Synergistaceae bacterium]
MKRISVFAVLAVLLLLLTGAAYAAEDTIKIGMLTPLTGFAAADGYSVHQSVLIAVDKVNAEG